MPTDKQSFLAELQTRLVELVRTTPASDVERNVRALLAQAFQRLELVTRDEFEVSTQLLEQLAARVKTLEDAVAALERGAAPAAAPGRDG